MSDNVKLTLKDYGFYTWLENIKPNKLKTALRQGLKKSLDIITKEAKKNLKQVTPNYNRGNNKWGLKLIKGVVTKIYKRADAKDDIKGVSEIMGQGKRSDFRLKFFENGTKDRYIKKSGGMVHLTKKSNSGTKLGFRGKMKAKPFFNPAIESKETEVHNEMEKNFQDSLEKAFDKFCKK